MNLLEINDFELSIIEYRNIIKAINDIRGFDLNEYALTSLKRRIENIMVANGLRNTELLIDRMREDDLFYERLLNELSVGSTEMFRDPSMWLFIYNEILDLLARNNTKFKVWFPACISGDELYTFSIILREKGLENKASIFASFTNNISLTHVRNGILNPSKLDICNDNYIRYNSNGKFSDYYKIIGDKVIRDTSLIKNVNFIKQNINFDNSPTDIKLIIYRNQTVYFTQNLQDKVFKVLNDSLSTGGFLIIGIKEQIGLLNFKNFKVVNEEENVYRKL